MNTDYQFLPPLLPDEFEALRSSIAERGVDVPIIVDQDGNIIDGYHRQRACVELGIFCPREVRQFESEADKLELILRLNCRRRQLNRRQKRSVIEAYLLRDPQIADNFLAQIIGVSKNTVADVRSTLEATCQIDKFEVLRGRDGKQRPAQYKKIIVDTPEKLDVACEIIGDLPESSAGKYLDVVKARREVEREMRRRDPHDFFPTPRGVTQALLQVEQFSKSVWEPCCGDGAMSEVLKDAGYSVTCTDLIDRGYGEIEDFLTSDRTVANIITNPPYTKRRAEMFVRKALACTTGKVAILLPLTFLEGGRRDWLFANSFLKWVYIFADRVSLYKGGANNRGNGRVAYAWFVWEHGYDGPPMLGRVHSGRKGVLLGPLDECARTPPIPLGVVSAELPINRRPELIKELCIHIEEAHELGRTMDANVLLGELSKWESVPFSTLRRLVKELPDEVRRLLNNGLPPAA